MSRLPVPVFFARRSLVRTGAIVAGLAIGVLSGCTQYPYSREVDRVEVQKGFGHRYTGDSSNEYWIGIGDGIKVTSFDNSELSFTSLVGPDGKITLPLIGDVKVAGLTTQELKDRLTELLLKYYRSVDLFVTVPFKNSKKIYLVGVARGGRGTGGILRFEGDMTIMDVLGRYPPGEFADTDDILLIRGDPRTPQRYRVNYDELIQGVTTTNYSLREDDIIYVPPTTIAAIGIWIDDALYPVKVLTNAAGLLFRAALVPARFQSIDEVSARISGGQNFGGGRGDFFL